MTPTTTRPTVVVICTRHPDFSNEFEVFPDDRSVQIVDVDLGRSDLTDPSEYEDWKASHEQTAVELEQAGYPEAAACLRDIVEEPAPDGDQD